MFDLADPSVISAPRPRRVAEDCPFRQPSGPVASGEAVCGLAANWLGDGATPPAVGRATCEACSRCLAPPEDLNPVVASLIYAAAGELLRDRGLAGPRRESVRRLREQVSDHLAVAHPGLPGRTFPPEAVTRGPASLRPRGSSVVWQVGVLTAPRAEPTLGETLRSLEEAGFGSLSVFAEPDSPIPEAAQRHRVVLRRQRLGNFANFYSALAELYERGPDADAFALFQDDVRVARGAKAWWDSQLWPHGAGLVSLFTPLVHGDDRAGWRLASPGYWRIHGAQALLFRRDVLERFLADPRVLDALRHGRHWDDTVVAGWAARERVPIAYHTPSLVQHVGYVSSIHRDGPDPRNFADALRDVGELPRWRPPARRPAKVGLVGWRVPNGLGYQADDMARHLAVDRWLVPMHSDLPPLAESRPGCRIDYASLATRREALRAWCRGLDWVIFPERPYFPNLAEAAGREGVGVACVPNWERFHADLPWLRHVDLMICPTRHTYAHVLDCRDRHGFGWDVIYVPWPVDVARFRFRRRRTCRRFLFVNGWGGGRGQLADGSPTAYGRKGLEVIAAAARLAPHLSFLVYSQLDGLPDLPRNVERRPPPASNRRLYTDGDVCVQPSHWEGIGLQLLECQAAGLPLVTTDAPPMNEYRPLATIPAASHEIVFLNGNPIASPLMRPEDLVEVLERFDGADVSDASRAAREYVERERSWATAGPLIREALVAY